MILPKIIDSYYHGDNYLKDGLLKEVDISRIQEELPDRMTRSSQKAVDHIGNLL